MASATLEQYLKGMHTNSFTCNWDVAVTYNQQQINALLADRFNQPGSGLTTQIDIREKVEDRYGEYYQNYHFNVGPPLIQFAEAVTVPTCSLIIAIVSGSIWTSQLDTPDIKEDEQQLDPDTYRITVYGLGLAVLDGNSNVVGDANSVIKFPPDAESDRYIVINIPTYGEVAQHSFFVEYPSGYNPPFAMKAANLLTALKAFFRDNVKRIAYTLAQINNHKPTNGVLDLVPQSFKFVTYGSNPSFLSLLIQTRSGWGNISDVQAQWINNWSNIAGVAPVPKNQSASIIINSMFFFETFIRPGLSQASSITEISVPISDSVGGIRAECRWPGQTRESHFYRNGSIDTDWNRWPLEYTWSEMNVPAVSYDPNNGTPLRVSFGHSNGFGKPATMNLYWQYKYKSTWTGKQVKRYSIKEPGGPIEWLPSTKDYYGSFTTTYTLDRTIELTDLTNEDLSINVGVNPGDWKTTAVPDEGGGFWEEIGSIFGGSYNPGTIPTFVRDTTMGGIGFSFSFGKLRFFSVTNVLLPGQKVIEVNIKNGLGIPRDCVVVGDVIQSRSDFSYLKY